MFIEKTLGQLCELGKGKIQTGPFGSQLHQADYSEEGTPVIMPADIIDGKISETKIARVSEDHVMRLERHQLAIGDIVYGRRGDIGRQALITSKEEGWLCGTGCLRVTVGKKSPIDPEYLHLFLKMPDVISYIQNQAIGATMPNLNTEILKRIPIRYPEKIADQKKVIAVLKAYFELIENNKKRIQILENMAEELYKEWFVRFRFPNWENTEFEKGVPVTFKIRKISEVYKTASGGTPSRKVDEYFVGDINWFKTGELKSLYTFESEEKISEMAVEKSAAKLLPKDTVVIAMYCAMPDISILSQPSCINQACCAFLSKKENISHIYTYYLIKNAQVELIKYAHGAAQQNLSQELIQNFSILIAPSELRNQFHNVLEPLFEEIKMLNQQIFNLDRQKRDLLPRLISGKLSVEDLDIQFPPSMQEQ